MEEQGGGITADLLLELIQTEWFIQMLKEERTVNKQLLKYLF